jgi:hypothetical protein
MHRDSHLAWNLQASFHCVTYTNIRLLCSPIPRRRYATRLFAPGTSPISLGGITVDAAVTYSATYTPCTPSLSTKMQTTTQKARGAAPASTVGPITAPGNLRAAAALIARPLTATKRFPRRPRRPRLTAEADLLSGAYLSRRIRVCPKASARVYRVTGIGALFSHPPASPTNLSRRNGR